jgi:two-component system, NarL family, invasion response regulator UvrY
MNHAVASTPTSVHFEPGHFEPGHFEPGHFEPGHFELLPTQPETLDSKQIRQGISRIMLPSGPRSVSARSKAPAANTPQRAIPSMIRIIIADDHAIVRAGLKQFLAAEKDMVVIGEAADGMETLACVRKSECDVVLLDISMPGKNGIDTLRQLKRSRPDLPVLILSAYSEEQFAVSLLRAGANGYISKETASEQLVAAIRTVIGGGKYVSPGVAQVLVSDLSSDSDKPPHATLSKREFQIFYRLASGESVSKIAEELFLSVKTVSTYRARILEKMQMTSNANLTYYAVKNNIIE